MGTEWKPEECRIQVCLLFDEISFPTGDPTSLTLESAATLSKDSCGLDLSKCVVDRVDVISTETQIGKDADRPILFFLKLYSADNKLLTPTVLCSLGHPVSKTCKAKTYFERVKDEREERLARDFGFFIPWEEETIDWIQNDKKALETLLKKVGKLGISDSEPVTEKKSGGFSKFRAEEHDSDLVAWDSTIRHDVEECFHNMTSIRGELPAIGNENKEKTSKTSPALIRIVLDIRLRAAKKPSSN